MIVGILQARVSSTRLPGKVLKPILGVPMLGRQIERLRRAKSMDRLLVATSTDASDDSIEAFCRGADVNCFRGSLNDVLDRFYQAAHSFSPEHVIRLTGDCPLADPQMIDNLVDFYLKGRFDYASNALEPTFPDGLDAEVFRFSCLETAWREATSKSDREHVTPFIWRNRDRFRIGSFKNDVDRSAERWTVDEPEDFELVASIFSALYPVKSNFGTEDILSFLDKNPGLRHLNSGRRRNEGFEKSLAKDSGGGDEKGSGERK